MTVEARKIKGDVFIKIPLEEVHSFRVAMHPVRVGEPVSKSTQAIRDSVDRQLAKIQSQGK